MWMSFRSSVQTIAGTAVHVLGSLIWGPVLVAASLWVWFAIGNESAITIAMGLLGVSMTVVGLFVRQRSRPPPPKMLERLLQVLVGAWMVWQFANWIIDPTPISPWFWVGLGGPIVVVLLLATVTATRER